MGRGVSEFCKKLRQRGQRPATARRENGRDAGVGPVKNSVTRFRHAFAARKQQRRRPNPAALSCLTWQLRLSRRPGDFPRDGCQGRPSRRSPRLNVRSDPVRSSVFHVRRDRGHRTICSKSHAKLNAEQNQRLSKTPVCAWNATRRQNLAIFLSQASFKIAFKGEADEKGPLTCDFGQIVQRPLERRA